LPARFWELGLGALGALWPLPARLRTPLRALAIPVALLLAALPLFSVRLLSPPMALIGACVGTWLLLDANRSDLAGRPLFAPLRWLGDISYSLYLTHWPVIALLNNAWFGVGDEPLPNRLKLVAVALSFAIAVPLHYLVERPIHRATRYRWRTVLLAAVAGAAMVVGIKRIGSRLFPQNPNVVKRFSPNWGLDWRCNPALRSFRLTACRTAVAPSAIVWGDSHAMHLVPALALDTAQFSLMQATMSACGPLVGVAGVAADGWTAKCLAFNHAVMRLLETTPSVHLVILAGVFDGYVNPHALYSIEDSATGVPREWPGSQVRAQAALRRMVTTLHRMGKRVVVVGSPPSISKDISRCVARRDRGQTVLGMENDCTIPVRDYRRERRNMLTFLDAVERENDVGVVRIADYWCGATTCRVRDGSTVFYRDKGHLSIEGSEYLGRTADFKAQLLRRAR
jgi:hypothetical protein